MKFLIDECLHISLAQRAIDRGYQAHHINWLGLSGTADWDIMPRILRDDYTFVTNNARDFRRLYSRELLHAGLVIIVPQVSPDMQCRLFDIVLVALAGNPDIVNEVIEVEINGSEIDVLRYDLP